jgi:hypothetical protein
MARTYATIDAGIWDDPEFCALTAGAQRTYFMLITQTDITAVGSLALTLRRWSKTCSEKDLEVWLAELADARFVVIDEDSEELLVRTFAKWDGGYKHAKRRMAVVSYTKAIRSQTLRDAAIEELAKLGVSLANPMPPDREPDAIPEATGSGRSVVNVGDHKGTPHSTLQEREPPPSIEDVEPPLYCVQHPNGTDKRCGPCGSARLRHQRWQKREERRKAEVVRARDAAVLAEIAEAKANAVPRSAVSA